MDARIQISAVTITDLSAIQISAWACIMSSTTVWEFVLITICDTENDILGCKCTQTHYGMPFEANIK